MTTATAEAPPAAAPAAVQGSTTSPVPVAAAPGAAPAPVPTPAPAAAGPDYSKLVAPKDNKYLAANLAQHVEWARKNNLSPEAAQAALDQRHADHLGNVAAFEAEAKGWPDALKADPNFGGKNYDQSIKNRDAILDRAVMVNPALKEAVAEFKASPWANHPLFAQVLAGVGSLFAEKPVVTGSVAVAPASAGKKAFPNPDGRYMHWTKDEAAAYDAAHGITKG